jgi:Arc/MetJ family transcription regulator
MSFVIDTEAVTRAQEVLGTKTLTETVDLALREVVDRERRPAFLERLAT